MARESHSCTSSGFGSSDTYVVGAAAVEFVGMTIQLDGNRVIGWVCRGRGDGLPGELWLKCRHGANAEVLKEALCMTRKLFARRSTTSVAFRVFKRRHGQQCRDPSLAQQAS